MTNIELAKVSDRGSISTEALSKAVMILLMVVGLMMSISLLKWAVNNKLENADAITGNTVTAQVREHQLGCLAKNIYHEAGNEPFEGKVAVAQVTMNRVENGRFGDGVCGVIFQKNIIYEKVLCQFSWVCDRVVMARPVNKEVYNESMEVAKKVLLEGFRLPSITEAIYYHADYINPGWTKQKITKIGHHIFYKG